MARAGALRLQLVRFLTSVALVLMVNGSAAAGQIGFVYALQQISGGANQIHGFRFDQLTGSLTPLPGFPTSSGGNGAGNSHSEQLAYANGRLFVVNNGSDTLSVFSVNQMTGALTAMPYSPVALGVGNWACVSAHSRGSPVVVGDGGNFLASLVVTDISALPAAGSPYATGAAGAYSCHINQAGTHAYTGGAVGDVAAGFSINFATGVLTALAGSPFDLDGVNSVGYATDGSGRLFTAVFNANHLRAFTTAAGVPTAVAGNPFLSGLNEAIHGVLHPGGYYMTVSRSTNQVGVYLIAGAGAATTLAAIAGSPFATGGLFSNALALTSNGGHLLAANGTSRNLTVFQVNQSTGFLSTVAVQPVNTLGIGGNVTGLVYAPGEAGFVYALQQLDGATNQIYGFRINPSTGGLTALPGFPVAAGLGEFGTFAGQLAYLNGRLYGINAQTLSAFKVNRTTGALTPLPFSPLAFTGSGACVAVHPSGSPVLVGSSSGFHSFDVNAANATVAPGSPFATGASPFSCAFSADGNFAYTGGNAGDGIAGFSVDPTTGVLTTLAGSPFLSGAVSPVGYATDSNGRLFVSSFGGGVRVFTSAAGALTAVAGNPFASGLAGGIQGILSPFRFYMVADREGDSIGVFQIAGNDGATTLTAVALSPFAAFGTFTDALTQTTDGRFVVAANGVSRNLTVFRVNPTTGVLTLAGAQPVDTLGASGVITGIAFAAVVPPFIDDPLTALPPLSRVIKAVHIAELRARIEAVRAQYGLGPLAYTDPALSIASTVVRGTHVAQLRDALAEVYVAAGLAAPTYTDPTLSIGVTVVKLAHIAELRAAVMAIE